MSSGEIISMLALLVAAASFILNGKKGTREDATTLGEIRGKLDSISAGIDNIRVEIMRMRDTQNDHAARIVACEQSCKSMHKRLDDHMQQHHSKE